MAFRAEEAARIGLERVEEYLVPSARNTGPEVREQCKEALRLIVGELGPVVDSYPSWHPLVSQHKPTEPVMVPGTGCGYAGLDHTRYFRNGFITCPYTRERAQLVVDTVNQMKTHPIATLTAEILDVPFYSSQATSVLVKCHWGKPLAHDGMIPAQIAVPLMLEQELKGWLQAERGETWETMRPYFLGTPRGSVSSLFVTQETGQSMKKIWNLVINTGMYGPIKV